MIFDILEQISRIVFRKNDALRFWGATIYMVYCMSNSKTEVSLSEFSARLL